MMRTCIAIALMTGTASAEGSLSLQMPTPPMNYQSDRFRAGNLDCSNAIGGGTNLELGVMGGISNVGGGYALEPQSKDIGVFARIVIPLDKPRSRINCNELYMLELQQRRLEIMKLQEELEQLRQLQEEPMRFEN